MTLDELTVKITVAAEEAMEVLDELVAKEKLLSGAFGGKYRVEVDGGKAVRALGEIGQTAVETSKKLSGVDFGRSFTEAKETLSGLAPDFSVWLREKYEGMLDSLEAEGVYISSGMREVFWNVLNNAFSLGEFESFEQLETMVESTLSRLSDAMRDPRIGEAVETLRQYWDVMGEGSLNDAQRSDMSGAWRRLFDDDGDLVELLSDIPGITENAAQSLIALGLHMEAAGEESGRLTERLFEGMQGMEDASGHFDDTAESAKRFGAGLAEQKEKLRDVLGQLLELGRENSSVDRLAEMRKRLEECEAGSEDYEKALAALKEEMSLAGIQADKAGSEMEGIDGAISAASAAVTSAAGTMAQQLQAVVNWAARARSSVNISGSVRVNTGGAISALNSVIAKAGQTLALLRTLGMATAAGVAAAISGYSGGGGGSGKSKREQEIEDYYALIEHKKRLDQLTLEEELKMLNTLRSKYSLTADERMEWEEKVYAVKKAIRERDAEEIDRLSQGVAQALEKRYEAMQEKELTRLDESREAWKKWRDDSVGAIEAQIEALERLEENEERENRDAEELRKIEKLRQAMEYEQDLFNREMLKIQLEEAIAAREERLRKEQLSQQKAALEEEIKRISQSAEQQLKALDAEEEQIRAYYEERMQTAAIQAEAEKMVLAAKQGEIMELLYAYVPEYEALGQSMGERLLDGFMKKVGNITTWFGNFNKGIAGMQKTLADASVLAAERFYVSREEAQKAESSVVVTQNVNFNQPVESPAQVARRMEDVNDALGQLLC